MKNPEDLHEGSRVNYTPYEGAAPYNGIVKRHSDDIDKVFVVYHCGGDWENYKDYTAALSPVSNLELGWV